MLFFPRQRHAGKGAAERDCYAEQWQPADPNTGPHRVYPRRVAGGAGRLLILQVNVVIIVLRGGFKGVNPSHARNNKRGIRTRDHASFYNRLSLRHAFARSTGSSLSITKARDLSLPGKAQQSETATQNSGSLQARRHLAFTRYCHHQYCMLNGKTGGGRGETIYRALLIAKYNGEGVH